jgi:hypothetical protein
MICRRIALCGLLLVAPQILCAEPQWLTDARSREGQLAEPHDIRSSDGWLRARLPVAVTGKIEKLQGSYTVEFSIGSVNTASCEIIPDIIDPAAFLRLTAEKTFADLIAKSQGTVEQRGIETVDAGAFGATPYLSLAWLYRVNDGKEKRVGAFKQYAAVKQRHGIYCAHIDLGYVQTFRSIVQALVESLVFEEKISAATPFYHEISVAGLRGSRIGYSILTLERDADGDVKAVESSAVILQVTADSATFMDTMHLEWTHPDGALINAVVAESLNGDVDANLALEARQGHWQVKGEFKGKKLEQAVETPGPPGTWLSHALQRRALLKAEPSASQEALSTAWLSADPIHFTETRTALVGRTADTGQATVRESAGGIVADVTVDASTGQELSAVIPLGSQTITMQRIDTQGSY